MGSRVSDVAAGFDLAPWSAARIARVDAALAAWVGVGAPEPLGAAMRYAVQGGGKRLRPLLVFATCEAASGVVPPHGAGTRSDAAALRSACAVEIIHAYSLVHDDMPCMDDDVLRRGQPTVHVRYGEAMALLAGDALQAFAFELLLPPEPAEGVDPAVQAVLCGLLARAAGHGGMAGGQAIDLTSVGKVLDELTLRAMHGMKTGALLQASIAMGAACAGLPPQGTSEALQRFGAAIGLAFQVVDDILDVTADSATLGKTAGKDAAADKPTYVALMGLDGARRRAADLLAEALSALQHSGLRDTRALEAIARQVVHRAC